VGSGINFIDLAGCAMLAQETRRLRVNGRLLSLCSLKGEAREILRRGGCLGSIGEENVFLTKTEALARLVPQLDPERCRVCTLRIFRECAQMPGPPDSPATTAA